ncbi:hypothetical protein LTR85_005854 [Meristemomyces frigidus]|nr:hypothetical protein LTR85_005854 [Meristemomyces frigidus]
MAIITYSSSVDDEANALEVWPPMSKTMSIAGDQKRPYITELVLQRDLDRRRKASVHVIEAATQGYATPKVQRALLLHGLRQPYELTNAHAIPTTVTDNEMIVRVLSIGLNPVDWKSVLWVRHPALPYVAGRDFAGMIVKYSSSISGLREGDIVLCASTDYRDMRKAAFQEYAVALEHNVCKLPEHVSVAQGAAIGVAYVAAALALGVCLGLRLPRLGAAKDLDLREEVWTLPPESIPADVRAECLQTREEDQRPHPGQYLVIWGGSSTSALFISQLARLAGLKVILVVDVAKHGARLSTMGWNFLVDSQDANRAVEVIRGITGGRLRFAIDTVGPKTASCLARCLMHDSLTPGHLVALAALPKEPSADGVVYHSVPMKLFHEVPGVGRALMAWLQQALAASAIELPEVTCVKGGLSFVNGALDQMRRGEVSGRRIVVSL